MRPHQLLLLVLLFYIILCRFARAYGSPTLPVPVATVTELKTGDVVLFSGRSIDSLVIQAWTDEIFTHIGLIYVRNGIAHVWNSDALTDAKCVLTNETRTGAQLQTLHDKLLYASGDTYIVPAKQALYWSWSWMKQMCHVEFRHNIAALLHAALPSIVPELFTSQDELYCSELVGLTLTHATGQFVQRQVSPLQVCKSAGYDLSGILHLPKSSCKQLQE